MNVAANTVVTFGHCKTQTALFWLGQSHSELHFLGRQDSTLETGNQKKYKHLTEFKPAGSRQLIYLLI